MKSQIAFKDRNFTRIHYTNRSHLFIAFLLNLKKLLNMKDTNLKERFEKKNNYYTFNSVLI